MVENANVNENPLRLDPGDYVYLRDDTTGRGKKLKSRYTGPYVVHDISSPHLVVLANPDTKRVLKHAVHINRLKIAYVRVPNPSPYFPGTVVKNEGFIQQ